MARRRKKSSGEGGRFRIDRVNRKNEAKRVSQTTGERASEGCDGYDYGQFPHCYRVRTTGRRQASGEPYWKWECRCGAKSTNAMRSERGAKARGHRHFLDNDGGKTGPDVQRAIKDNTLTPEDRAALGRLADRRDEISPQSPESDHGSDQPTRSSPLPVDLPEDRLRRLEIASEAEKKREKRPRPPRQR